MSTTTTAASKVCQVKATLLVQGDLVVSGMDGCLAVKTWKMPHIQISARPGRQMFHRRQSRLLSVY